MIDQTGANAVRGHGEEVGAILPLRARLLLRESQVRFVNQRGGLQRVPRPLTTQVAGRDAPQLRIDLLYKDR